MPEFELVAPFQPTGDQPQAIEKLADGLARGLRHQTLLGVTGSGKSLHPDEPVLVGHENEFGEVRWAVEPIGPLVDGVLGDGPTYRDDHGTEVAFRSPEREGLLVATVDPDSHAEAFRPVTAVSRHTSPPELWTVRTEDGRRVRVTGDHNFVRLGPGSRLETAETMALRPGDWLPLPAKIPAPVTPVRRYAAAPALIGRDLYVTGPSVDLGWPHGVRRSLRHGLRVPLESVGSAGVATMERFGRTQITSRNGSGSIPASRPIDADWLRFLGLFVAEGHVADRYATLTPGPEGLPLARALATTCGLRYFERSTGELVFGVKATVETLRTLCGNKAAAKHLPPLWASLDDLALGALLAGYFEGDGWNETRRGAVSAVTKSERLASELSYALLRLGIQARLFTTWKRAVGTSHRGDTYWRVDVRGADDLATFERTVGFVGPRKRAELRATVGAAVGGNADCLPERANGAVLQARAALGLLQRDLVHDGCSRASVSLIETGRRRLRRDHARAFVQLFRAALAVHPSQAAEQAICELERLLACRWTRVASVVSTPTTATHVYDLSVEASETFLAGFGGLIVHNTYSIAQVIERVARPTLVLAHNKTLAAQLYAEFRDFFPNNAVEYFVELLRLLPAGGVPAALRHLHREGLQPERGDRQAPPRGHQGPVRAARRDHRGVRQLHLRPGRPRRLRRNGAAAEGGRAVSARRRSASSRGPPVPAQRPGTPALAVPRPGRHAGARPVVGGPPRAGRVLRRRDRADHGAGPADRRAARGAERAQRVPGDALRHAGGQAAARDGDDRRRAGGAAGGPGGGGPRARGGAAPPADDVRPRDDARARLLHRDRELLAPPLGSRARQPALDAARLLPAGLAAGRGRIPHVDPAGGGHVQERPDPQGDPGRLRVPPAVRARQPPAHLRGVRGDGQPGRLRVGHAGPLRAGEEPADRRAAGPAHRDRGPAASRSARPRARSTTSWSGFASASSAASGRSSPP